MKNTARTMFNTTWNFQRSGVDYEMPVGVSETIPDMSYTVREIMEKFTVGLAPHVLKNGQFDENENLGFDDYDPTRQLDYDLADATMDSILIKNRQDEIFRNMTEKENLKNVARQESLEKYERWKRSQSEIEAEKTALEIKSEVEHSK
jgi:ABC-type uncharacterized transport system substrate-binding protein